MFDRFEAIDKIPMWIREKNEIITISCQIQPRASRTEVIGLHGEPPRLKIRVASPPVDGAANEELIVFLSKKLKVPKKQIEILSGHSGKFKEISIAGLTLEKISQVLIG